MLWTEMGFGEKFAYVKQAIIVDGWTYPKTAAAVGAGKNAIAGFVHRHRDALLGRAPAPAPEQVGQSQNGTGGGQAHNDARYTETWDDFRARRAKARGGSDPTAKLAGRPRAEIVWSEEKKAKFKVLYNKGTLYKVIRAELGIGSNNAISQAVLTLGLKPRQRPDGGKRREIKVRIDLDEEAHIRKRGSEMDMSMSRYVARLIRLDRG